jgi:hypothetical protein
MGYGFAVCAISAGRRIGIDIKSARRLLALAVMRFVDNVQSGILKTSPLRKRRPRGMKLQLNRPTRIKSKILKTKPNLKRETKLPWIYCLKATRIQARILMGRKRRKSQTVVEMMILMGGKWKK